MMFYIWLKAFHVVSVTAWGGCIVGSTMAIAYQSSTSAQPANKTMYLQLHLWTKRVTSPTTFVVWLSGVGLALAAGDYSQRWVVAKMGAMLVLTAIQAVLAGDLANLVSGRVPSGLFKHRYFAMWSILLLWLIVCLTVFRGSMV